MINILVTGAEGQLGNEIKKLSGSFKELNFELTDVSTLDITNIVELDSFFSIRSIQYIVNCAAYTNVDKAEEDFENAYKVNVLAVKNLAQLAQKYNCKIIHISTDYVFDSSSQNFPFKESDLPLSDSVYGSTKLLGENELFNSSNCIIIRTSWLYSSFGRNILKTILKLGKERRELNFIFDQVGTPTYAGDLAYVIMHIVNISEESKLFLSGIYHYSNEGVCSWYDFAVAVIKRAGLDCKVKPIETKDYPLPAKRPFYSVLNKSKIKNTFNIEIPYWIDSLEKCLKEIL
jgi:dTDP-4-dehydrorhamnose reductase